MHIIRGLVSKLHEILLNHTLAIYMAQFLPVTFVTHLSSMTQLEEVREPWHWLWEWRKAMPRAMSLANVSLKSQLRGICSFCSTSFRLPLGQYSVMMATLGGTSSNVIPMNLHKLGWSKSLIKGKYIRMCYNYIHWCHSLKYVIYFLLLYACTWFASLLSWHICMLCRPQPSLLHQLSLLPQYVHCCVQVKFIDSVDTLCT